MICCFINSFCFLISKSGYIIMSMVACGKMRHFKNQTQPHTHAVYVDPYDVKLNHELSVFWEAGLPRTCIVHGRRSFCVHLLKVLELAYTLGSFQVRSTHKMHAPPSNYYKTQYIRIKLLNHKNFWGHLLHGF